MYVTFSRDVGYYSKGTNTLLLWHQDICKASNGTDVPCNSWDRISRIEALKRNLHWKIDSSKRKSLKKPWEKQKLSHLVLAHCMKSMLQISLLYSRTCFPCSYSNHSAIIIHFHQFFEWVPQEWCSYLYEIRSVGMHYISISFWAPFDDCHLFCCIWQFRIRSPHLLVSTQVIWCKLQGGTIMLHSWTNHIKVSLCGDCGMHWFWKLYIYTYLLHTELKHVSLFNGFCFCRDQYSGLVKTQSCICFLRSIIS